MKSNFLRLTATVTLLSHILSPLAMAQTKQQDFFSMSAYKNFENLAGSEIPTNLDSKSILQWLEPRKNAVSEIKRTLENGAFQETETAQRAMVYLLSAQALGSLALFSTSMSIGAYVSQDRDYVQLELRQKERAINSRIEELEGIVKSDEAKKEAALTELAGLKKQQDFLAQNLAELEAAKVEEVATTVSGLRVRIKQEQDQIKSYETDMEKATADAKIDHKHKETVALGQQHAKNIGEIDRRTEFGKETFRKAILVLTASETDQKIGGVLPDEVAALRALEPKTEFIDPKHTFEVEYNLAVKNNSGWLGGLKISEEKVKELAKAEVFKHAIDFNIERVRVLGAENVAITEKIAAIDAEIQMANYELGETRKSIGVFKGKSEAKIAEFNKQLDAAIEGINVKGPFRASIVAMLKGDAQAGRLFDEALKAEGLARESILVGAKSLVETVKRAHEKVQKTVTEKDGVRAGIEAELEKNKTEWTSSKPAEKTALESEIARDLESAKLLRTSKMHRFGAVGAVMGVLFGLAIAKGVSEATTEVVLTQEEHDALSKMLGALTAKIAAAEAMAYQKNIDETMMGQRLKEIQGVLTGLSLELVSRNAGHMSQNELREAINMRRSILIRARQSIASGTKTESGDVRYAIPASTGAVAMALGLMSASNLVAVAANQRPLFGGERAETFIYNRPLVSMAGTTALIVLGYAAFQHSLFAALDQEVILTPAEKSELEEKLAQALREIDMLEAQIKAEPTENTLN